MVRVKPLAVGLARRAAGCRVLAVHHVDSELRKRDLLALEVDHVARIELVIFADECVVLALEIDDTLVRGIQRDLHFLQNNLAEFVRENLLLRVLEERLVELIHRVVILGRNTVKVGLLARIKFIFDIHGIADIDGSVREIILSAETLMCLPDIQNLLFGLRLFGSLDELPVVLLNARDIRTAIFKFAEFHATSPSINCLKIPTLLMTSLRPPAFF